MAREIRAKEAFERVKPTAEALSAGALLKPHVKSSDTKVLVLRLLAAVERLGLRPRLEKLAEIGEFDLATLERLSDLQWALTYTQTAGKDAAAGPQVVAVSDEGKALRKEMLVVLRYHLTDPASQALLDDIERGRSYADLADDMIRLAALYVQHHDTLAHDKSRYQAEHATQAQDVAERLVDGLASTQDKAQRELYLRLWTLLAQSYNEVHATALWLLRADPATQANIPALAAPRVAKDADPSDPTPPPS